MYVIVRVMKNNRSKRFFMSPTVVVSTREWNIKWSSNSMSTFFPTLDHATEFVKLVLDSSFVSSLLSKEDIDVAHLLRRSEYFFSHPESKWRLEVVAKEDPTTTLYPLG